MENKPFQPVKYTQKEIWENNIREYWKVSEELFHKITDKIPDGAKVLDLGCGDGELLKQLEESGKDYNLTGADISEKVTDVASKNVPDAKYISLEITEEDIPEKYDAIFMKFVLGCLKNKKYSSQEKLCDAILEKIAKSCDQFVLITPVLKNGLEKSGLKSIYVDAEVLRKLIAKHFNKAELIDTQEGKREFNYETYLLSNQK
jgi:SAM-dependent methyltransferase